MSTSTASTDPLTKAKELLRRLEEHDLTVVDDAIDVRGYQDHAAKKEGAHRNPARGVEHVEGAIKWLLSQAGASFADLANPARG